MSDYVLEKSVFTNLLSVFLPSTYHDEFNKKLQECSAIIAGSWPLYLVQASQERKELIQTSTLPSWMPADMDIWISSTTWQQLENWFSSTVGFKIQPVTYKPLNYGNILGYHQVYECRSDSIIQFVVLYTEEEGVRNIEATVMQHFDLSPVKSFWNGSVLRVCHVNITKGHQMFLTGNTSHEPRLEKYKNRGFQLISKPPLDEIVSTVPILDINRTKLQIMQSAFTNCPDFSISKTNIITINDFIRKYRNQIYKQVTTGRMQLDNLRQTISTLKSIKDDTHRSLLDVLIKEYNCSYAAQLKENKDNLELCNFFKVDGDGYGQETDLGSLNMICPICVECVKTTVFQCGHTSCLNCANTLISNGSCCFVCRERIISSHPFYV